MKKTMEARQWDPEVFSFNTESNLYRNCTRFCKITTGHGNTIKDLANIINNGTAFFFLCMPKYGNMFNDLPGFEHLLTLSVLDLGLRNGSALGKNASLILRKL